MTSVARSEECPNGLSNTSPFSLNLRLIELTSACPFTVILAVLHSLAPSPFIPILGISDSSIH